MTMTIQEFARREAQAYKIFEKCIKPGSRIVIAYSGGKDSTALAILLYRWMKIKEMRGVDISLLHNDTLSEINPMEEWAKKFMDQFSQKLRRLGNNVTIKIATPPPIDTFYWRVIVRGYPAMSFNFRWCVKLLKVQPTGKSISNLEGGSVMLTGLRENESNARAQAMQKKYGGCAMGASKCLAYYFLIQNDKENIKAAPLRDWSTADVWEFMRNAKEFDISDLLYLYGCDEARYGCWHCTLTKVQWGLHSLKKDYLYFDGLRVLYRKISDLPELRAKKKSGYSKLGPLNTTGRSMMFHLMTIAEDLSGLKLYGLDAINVDGKTLRQLFYATRAQKAMRMILNEDKEVNKKRVVDISEIRDLDSHKALVTRSIRKLRKACENNKARLMAMNAGVDPTTELLDNLEKRLK